MGNRHSNEPRRKSSLHELPSPRTPARNRLAKQGTRLRSALRPAAKSRGGQEIMTQSLCVPSGSSMRDKNVSFGEEEPSVSVSRQTSASSYGEQNLHKDSIAVHKKKHDQDREFMKESMPAGIPAIFLQKRGDMSPNDMMSESTSSYRRPSMYEASPVLGRALSIEEMKKEQLQTRRRSAANSNSTRGRLFSTSSFHLTGPQIILLRAAWRQVLQSRGSTVIGADIVNKLFFKMPDARNLMQTTTLPAHVPTNDHLTKWHHKVIGDMMDLVVRNLDHLEEIGPDIANVGRCHAIYHDAGIKAKFWNNFAEALNVCTTEWGDKKNRNEAMRKAWAAVAAFMCEKLKEGLQDERRNRSTAGSSKTSTCPATANLSTGETSKVQSVKASDASPKSAVRSTLLAATKTSLHLFPKHKAAVK